MSKLIISVSGLRGIVGETLDGDVAMRYARAFAAETPPGTLIIARDGRATGPMLAAAVEAALTGAGRDVLLADVAATPTVGVLVRALQAAGALQISASHNPPQYNGIKLFGNDGRVLSADRGAKIAERYRSGQLAPWVQHAHVGTRRLLEDTRSAHAQRVLETVDAGRIRRRSLHVLLDANHGAGGLLGRELLEQLGCRVTVLGAEPNGLFAHPPEPTADNLAGVRQLVREHQADIGFCQDPDADRLAVIDEQGRYVGEEYTLALCLDHRLRQSPGPIVTNCATSRMAEDLARKYGVAYHRAKVGEANVADVMIAEQAVFGGEGNGGPIDPRVGYVRDSFVGMAQILDAMAEREKPISQLVDELPRYSIVKTTVPLDSQQMADAFDRLERHFADARPDRQDGLRLDWSDRWLLVRGSNTEPIVRLIAEAPRVEQAQELCQVAEQVLASA